MTGLETIDCDGPRFQINNTSVIEHFSLVREIMYDPYSKTYCLIGLVDDGGGDIFNRNTEYFLTRKGIDLETGY